MFNYLELGSLGLTLHTQVELKRYLYNGNINSFCFLQYKNIVFYPHMILSDYISFALLLKNITKIQWHKEHKFILLEF